MFDSLIYFFSAVFLTFVFSLFMLRFVKVRCFLDLPNTRKIHKDIIPRFGGIPFSFVTLILSMVYCGMNSEYTWYIFGAFVMLSLGLIDDIFSISWRVKLCVQSVVGIALFVFFFDKISSISFFEMIFNLPSFLLFLVFIIWFLGVVNSINLVDGMDGLAGGTFFIVSLAAIYMGWFTGNQAFMFHYIILSGSLLAFLMFNARPAKFFMGDTGSLFLGFSLAVMPLLFFSSHSDTFSVLDMTPFVLISSYFILDTSRVFFIRLFNKRNPFSPDNHHMHHRLLAITYSYNVTLIVIFSMVLMFVIATIFYLYYKLSNVFVLFYFSFLFLCTIIPIKQSNILNKIVDFGVFLKNKGLRRSSMDTPFPHKLMAFIFFLYLSLSLFMVIFQFDLLYSVICGSIFYFIFLSFFIGYFKFKWSRRFTTKGLFICTSLFLLLFFSFFQPQHFTRLFVYSRAFLLLIMMIAFMKFYSKYLFYYLLRFWRLEDILIIMFLLFLLGVLVIDVQRPLFFPSFWMIFELIVVYLFLGAVTWRIPLVEERRFNNI